MPEETIKEPAKETAADKKPAGIRQKHIAIMAVVLALVIGAFIFSGNTDAPTGKVLEPALTPEQIAEFNSIVAECNQYIAQRDNNNTIICLKKADAIKSDLAVVSGLADIYSITGNNVEAIGYYARAIQISPSDARIRYNYAIALEQINLTGDALAQYSNATELDANNTASMNNMGILLQKLKRFNESKQEFDAALMLEPNNTVIIANHANLLAEMGLNAEAEAGFRKAIALAPNDKGIYRNFAQFLYTNGRYGEAKDALEKSY